MIYSLVLKHIQVLVLYYFNPSQLRNAMTDFDFILTTNEEKSVEKNVFLIVELQP